MRGMRVLVIDDEANTAARNHQIIPENNRIYHHEESKITYIVHYECVLVWFILHVEQHSPNNSPICPFTYCPATPEKFISWSSHFLWFDFGYGHSTDIWSSE